jgi:hypothetical protein
MASLYKAGSPHIQPDNAPASTRQRAVYDRPRATAAETAVPVARKAVDQQMPKGNVGASQGVDDTAPWRAAKAHYDRHTNQAQQMKDRELMPHFEAWLNRVVGPEGLNNLRDMVQQKGLAYHPELLQILRSVGGAAANASLARLQEHAAGKTPLPATPTRQDHSKAHALYKGNADTPAAPAPARDMSKATRTSKATKLYGGSR